MTEAGAIGPGALRNLGLTYFQRRYTILFYTIILTVLASPMIATLGLSGALIESLLAANLLAALMPVNAGRNRNVLLAVMTAGWLARPATAWLGHPVLSAITLVTWTLIGLFAVAVALRFAMGGTKVDAEHLCAALSAYLLAGIYFRPFVLGSRANSPGHAYRSQQYFPNRRCLFQLCDTGNPRLWRYRTPNGCGTGSGNR